MSEDTVTSILREALRDRGYEGLWNEDIDCACLVEDLCPCMGDGILLCRPGYILPCPCDCGEHEFHVGILNPAGSYRMCDRKDLQISDGGWASWR